MIKINLLEIFFQSSDSNSSTFHLLDNPDDIEDAINPPEVSAMESKKKWDTKILEKSEVLSIRKGKQILTSEFPLEPVFYTVCSK